MSGDIEVGGENEMEIFALTFWTEVLYTDEELRFI